MFTISTAELKRFIKQSKHIQINTVISIDEFIRIRATKEKTTMTKVNATQFVISEVEADCQEPITILVREKSLITAVNTTTESEIEFRIEGGNVILDDKVCPIKSQTEDAALFKKTEEPSMEGSFELTSEILSAMTKAKHQVLAKIDNDVRAWMTFICCFQVNGKSYIVGNDGFIGYFKRVSELIPQFALDPDVINPISNYPLINFLPTEKHNFFQTLGVTYGFLKSEAKLPDITPFITKINPSASFTMRRSKLIALCERAIGLNVSAMTPQIAISDYDDQTIRFSFQDFSEANSFEELVRVKDKQNDIEEMEFGAANLIKCLKDSSIDELVFGQFATGVKFTSPEEPDYFGVAMCQQKKPTQ